MREFEKLIEEIYNCGKYSIREVNNLLTSLNGIDYTRTNKVLKLFIKSKEKYVDFMKDFLTKEKTLLIRKKLEVSQNLKKDLLDILDEHNMESEDDALRTLLLEYKPILIEIRTENLQTPDLVV